VTLAHIAGLPVEELLAMVPLAGVVAALGLLRHRRRDDVSSSR
jgi:hypothetical protein